MIEKLLSFTTLPNLHPALVHFPLALLPAAVLFDALCIVRRRRMWLDRAATALYALGFLGAWAAYLAGEEAEESLHGLSAGVGTLIEEHQKWAFRALMTFAVVALSRVGLAWWDRHQEEIGAAPVRALVLLAALAGLGLLFETAEHGGALVYRHGVAVSTAPPAPEPAAATAPNGPAPKPPAKKR